MESLGITHKLVKIYCIIHQGTLCAKFLKFKNVLNFVVKTVNLILSRGLNHRQFKQFLFDTQAEYGDLAYFCDVRWLSRGSMLKRVLALHKEVAIFLESKHIDSSHFQDPDWLATLAFIVDIVTHLNHLNLLLQGKTQLINEMYNHIVAFEKKLVVLYAHFP